jgi:hypothetical protein
MNAIWVAFTGKADVRFLKLLKPGFRHCFALIQGDERWLTVDPMLHKMDVCATHCARDFNLPGYLRSKGYRVVRAPNLCPARRMAVPSPFTCVEAMKRLIGLHDWRVFTPWQLYRRLLTFTHFQGESHGKPVFQA